MARLRPGVVAADAQSEMDLLYRRFRLADFGESDSPGFKRAMSQERLTVTPGSRGFDDLRKRFSDSLFILMATAGLTLLIACSNVANLLLARAVARSREVAVRLALGASSIDLARQFLTESACLAGAAGALGLLLAQWIGRVLVAVASHDVKTMPLDLHPDLRVLSFTASASCFIVVILALAPVVRALTRDLTTALKVSTGSASGARRFPVGGMLVIAQVALSLVVIVEASLFVRTLRNLRSFDVGYRRESIAMIKIDSSALTGYSPPRLQAVYERVLERLQAIPGVRSASMSYFNLLSHSGDRLSIYAEGRGPVPGDAGAAAVDYVSPSYFDTVGMRVVAGRGLTVSDNSAPARAAVVNETFAASFFPNEMPIGKRFGLRADRSDAFEIVGLVQDAKYDDLRENPQRRAFLPFAQRRVFAAQVRTAGSPESFAGSIRAAIHEAEPNLPVMGISTLQQELDYSLWQERLIAGVATFFGAVSLLLACMGLYGLLSGAVAQRTREIGIRMALGAGPSRVLRGVLTDALGLLAIGASTGVLAAVACGRWVSARLYGLEASDPSTILFAVAILLSVAALAASIPARRAAHLDPMMALRHD